MRRNICFTILAAGLIVATTVQAGHNSSRSNNLGHLATPATGNDQDPSAVASSKGYISGKGGQGIAHPGSNSGCTQGIDRTSGHMGASQATAKTSVSGATPPCVATTPKQVGIKEEGVK